MTRRHVESDDLRSVFVAWLTGLGSLFDLSGSAMSFDALAGDAEDPDDDARATILDFLELRQDYREAMRLFKGEMTVTSELQPPLFRLDQPPIARAREQSGREREVHA